MAGIALVLPAFANEDGNPQPLILKTSGGGLMPPEGLQMETCKVYVDRAVLEKTYGLGAFDRVLVSREVKLKISPNIK